MSGQMEQYLFHRGEYRQAYEYFGAHPTRTSTVFRIWAPSAKSVAVVGDFNGWTAREEDYCQKITNEGIWEVEIKKIKKGNLYKYQIETSWGEKILKSDPYAFYSELRPQTASIVNGKPKFHWADKKWLNNREIGYAKPINIYEVHLGSWKKKEDGTYYNYKEIAELLVEYMLEMNYTHIEIMPITEYPFDGSWGYQGTGYYSVTSRYGTPEDFMYFVNYFHKNNLGIILDWVPGHFCKDSHGLYRFDGSACYEYEDPSLGENEWGSANFNVSRNEVRSFLLSNLYFWIKEFHIDGIRMDAISNMLYYRDGLSENKRSVEFLQYLNQSLHEEYPNVMLIAEDSSAWPLVTKYQADGGLGFDFKWNMGWMNDTLKYMEQDPFFRKSHHGKLTFSFMYAFSENFILPLSHDEIVHGKNSILNKMPGYYEDKLAHVKNLYSYQMAHPGKKLNFMGNEIGQLREWDEQKSCDWFLLDYPMHDAFKRLCEDLGKIYTENDAFFDQDYDPSRFCWIDADNVGQNTFSFIRRGSKKDYVIIMNFSTNPYDHQQFGVPCKGKYKEILNTEWDKYNGNLKDHTPQEVQAMRLTRHNQPYMIEVNVPSFGAMIYEVEK